MDYFKHYSTASEGNTLNHIEDKFGHLGYSCWFKLMELCCNNWDGNSAPEFTFFETVVRRKLKISSAKLELFLKYCSEVSELSYNFSQKNLNICVPMLAEIKETRGRISGNKSKKIDIYRIEKDKEEDKEKEGITKFLSQDLGLHNHQESKSDLRLSNHFSSFDETQLQDSRISRILSNSDIPRPDAIIQLYNDKLAGKAGKIQYCRGLAHNQIKDFITTTNYKEFQSIKVWEELFDKVAQSPFLTGIQEGSTFAATLDWLIIHGNALKVLSGKYPAKNEEVSNNKFANLELN